MSDGSLDGGGVSDGGMNVCVCDVANDVVTDVGGGGVVDNMFFQLHLGNLC